MSNKYRLQFVYQEPMKLVEADSYEEAVQKFVRTSTSFTSTTIFSVTDVTTGITFEVDANELERL